MSDLYDDVAMMRAAGYYEAGRPDPDDEYAVPGVIVSSVTVNDDGSTTMTTNDYHAVEFGGAAHPHAAQPGHMPSVADVVAERDMLRGWLAAMTIETHITRDFDCQHCGANLYAGDNADHWYTDNPKRHRKDCPWRLAKEYLEKVEEAK